MNRPPFPSIFDSSIIATLRSCLRKMELEYILHYRPKTLSVHLHAGAAFAKALEVARSAYWMGSYQEPTVTKDEKGERSVTWKETTCRPGEREFATSAGMGALIASYGDFECPPDSAKSLERMMGAFEYAMEVWPLGGDGAEPILLPSGRRAVEYSFAEPLPINHPETGEPLVLAGRLDQVINYAGAIYNEDDKTTSQLGASWPYQWPLRSQFFGYAWATRKNGLDVKGTLVRGIAILKTKYNHAEALTYAPEWMIERWYEQVLRDIKRLMIAWNEGYYDYNLDHSCNEYGGCVYRQVCLMKDPSSILEQFFERRAWNPITRAETLL